jgi:lipopolysaccharide export system permease protein
MRTSGTLSRYIGRQFLFYFCMLLGILLSVILLIDTVELLRRAAGKPDATFTIVIQMAVFKLPEIGQQVFPFVILFAGMFTFWRLTRSQELVVARAVGVSAWQFLGPVLMVAPLIAVFQVTVINPVGSVLVARYEKMEDRYLRGRTSSLVVSGSGLWLRQIQDKGQVLIHAESVEAGTTRLKPVNVFMYDNKGVFESRIDAASATLQPGYWTIRDGWLNTGNGPAERFSEYKLDTDLTLERIQESFASPDSLSFWELPGFIKTLQDTGFSATRHRLHFQSLLSTPLLFCAMVLFAAAFSLRQTRRGGTMIMVAGGVVTGFVLFLFSDVVRAFGLSETIPVPLAAWAPAGASLLLGITVLLHLEDG